jgi:hypothetical protein
VAGSNAVRGFLERAVAVDPWLLRQFRGLFAGHCCEAPGCREISSGWFSLMHGRGFNLNPSSNERVNIASMGVGLRYNLKKDVVRALMWRA